MIAFLSDFGPASHYVGQVKARLPGLEVVDLCHDIPPGDIRAGAYVLLVSWKYFPPGTVFLAVVDPGVGTERKALAASWGDYLFVAPDNGILSPFMKEGFKAVSLRVPPDASSTFHARDVFAPGAERLARGARLEDLGEACPSPVHCPWFTPRQTPGGIRARIIFRDRFGNLITDVPGEMLEGRDWFVLARGKEIRPGTTYGDVERGEALALVGSGGFLELSTREEDASEELGLRVGDVVEVLWRNRNRK